MDERTTRRESLLRVGGLFGALALGGWKAAEAEGGGPEAVASGAVACVLTPELTEGPYYIPGEKVRRNITDGHKGTPLQLRLTVVDASTCRTIRGAAVDVWHADARGVYSGFDTGASSRTFMRGIQRTDASGLAMFTTVYPGWYPGRAVHVHVKVHVAGSVVHTGQLFFPDAVTAAAYRKAPYRARGTGYMRNAQDSIYVNGGKRSVLAMKRTKAGYTGRITMGVNR